MFEYKCELYLNGSWQSYDIYNQLRFDERKDGQVTTALCYIRTEQKTRFEPMREARIEMVCVSFRTTAIPLRCTTPLCACATLRLCA